MAAMSASERMVLPLIIYFYELVMILSLCSHIQRGEGR